MSVNVAIVFGAGSSISTPAVVNGGDAGTVRRKKFVCAEGAPPCFQARPVAVELSAVRTYPFVAGAGTNAPVFAVPFPAGISPFTAVKLMLIVFVPTPASSTSGAVASIIPVAPVGGDHFNPVAVVLSLVRTYLSCCGRCAFLKKII